MFVAVRVKPRSSHQGEELSTSKTTSSSKVAYFLVHYETFPADDFASLQVYPSEGPSVPDRSIAGPVYGSASVLFVGFLTADGKWVHTVICRSPSTLSYSVSESSLSPSLHWGDTCEYAQFRGTLITQKLTGTWGVRFTPLPTGPKYTSNSQIIKDFMVFVHVSEVLCRRR